MSIQTGGLFFEIILYYVNVPIVKEHGLLIFEHLTVVGMLTLSSLLFAGKSAVLGSLLCTVRAGISKDTFLFPPDGLCGIITFDSLYDSVQNVYNGGLEYFLEIARQHRTTEYAMGIEHR
ncbi:hypothetical protein MRX96_038983 [Rhipicephalus microplus]